MPVRWLSSGQFRCVAATVVLPSPGRPRDDVGRVSDALSRIASVRTRAAVSDDHRLHSGSGSTRERSPKRFEGSAESRSTNVRRIWAPAASYWRGGGKRAAQRGWAQRITTKGACFTTSPGAATTSVAREVKLYLALPSPSSSPPLSLDCFPTWSSVPCRARFGSAAATPGSLDPCPRTARASARAETPRRSSGRPAIAPGSPPGQCLRRVFGRLRVEPRDGTEFAQVPSMARCGGAPAGQHLEPLRRDRSEERRVGKECRSRWSPYH